MEFEVRCRMCGDVELFGSQVCRNCWKILGIGAFLGAILTVLGVPIAENLFWLVW